MKKIVILNKDLNSYQNLLKQTTIDYLSYNQKILNNDYLHVGEKVYSRQQIINEIKNNTEFGINYLKEIIETTIKQLSLKNQNKKRENLYTEKELHNICLKMMCKFGEHVSKTITGQKLEMIDKLMQNEKEIENWFNEFKRKNQKYILRAEALIDIQKFIKVVKDKITYDEINIENFEFSSILTLDELISILKNIDDCHVMSQTIAYDYNFTGIRNYNI